LIHINRQLRQPCSTNVWFIDNNRMNTKVSIFLIIITFSLIVGCAQIRKVTYPSDFVYLDHNLVQTAMLRISLAMRMVDETLMRGEPLNESDQQRVKKALSTIDKVTDRLATGNLVTNHLVIDEHIDDFKREVRNAIRTANSNPPNFYAATRLSANCVGCHRYRN
jgi:hypothetical protein